MSSETDTCLRKADDAKQRAAQATEPSIKSAYEKVAEHWKLVKSESCWIFSPGLHPLKAVF